MKKEKEENISLDFVLLYNNLRNSKTCIQNKRRSRWYEADEDTVGTVTRLRNCTMALVSSFSMATVQRQRREGGHVHLAPRLRTSGATHLLPLYVCLHAYMEKCSASLLKTAMPTLKTQSGGGSKTKTSVVDYTYSNS